MNSSLAEHPEIAVNIASGENSNIDFENESNSLRRRYNALDRTDDDSEDSETQEELVPIKPVIFKMENKS